MATPRAAELLGIPEDAPRHVVNEAFRTAIRINHPDHGGSIDRTLELIAAREALVGTGASRNSSSRPRTFVRRRRWFQR
jgi:hypothetical protein